MYKKNEIAFDYHSYIEFITQQKQITILGMENNLGQ